jgi:hypothetical protein
MKLTVRDCIRLEGKRRKWEIHEAKQVEFKE